MKMDRKEKKKPVWFWILVAAIAAFAVPGLYCGLTVRKYVLDSDKIDGPVRIALVTDLHSCRYGKGQIKLLEAIDEQHPDVILLGGDIFDDKRSDDNTESFLAGIAGKYPCYYVTGNHECWASKEKFQRQMDILEKYGIVRLAGDSAVLSVGEAKVRIFGVDDPHVTLVQTTDEQGKIHGFDTELAQCREALAKTKNGANGDGNGKKDSGGELEDANYAVLLAHRPELFSTYCTGDFDLVLAGHAHGGQWRIPGLLNGLYAPNQGLFPKLAGGLYQDGSTTMIVSRGLARESTPVPRFYNPPELVIIDLK